MSPTTTASRRYRALLDPLSYSPRDLVNDPDDSRATAADAWKLAHNNAVRGPRPSEYPIVALMTAWLAYADNYETQFNDPPTDPNVCREHSADYAVAFAEWRSDGAQDALPSTDDLACHDCYHVTYGDESRIVARYEDVCAACTRCNSRLSADYVLGEAWAEIGRQLRNLLNGDLGRLDGGTLDHAITSAFAYAGLDEEGQ